jgi:protein-S-isoprenylcysteine O-methyltransferase Ste14
MNTIVLFLLFGVAMALFVYFVSYFFFAFAWRSWLVYRRTKLNPVVLPKEDNAHGYVGRAFKLVMALIAISVLFQSLGSPWFEMLVVLTLLESSTAVLVGWCLLMVSLAWLLIAQSQMGNSWRIGIDSANKTRLVSAGLFGVSRNPIFLSMRVNLLGLLLVLPTTVTLVALVAGELLMQIQVRLEEAHLAALHGDDYSAYCNRVRRWL